MRSGVVPIRERSSICRTRNSAADRPKPPIVWRGQDAVLASRGPVCQQPWPNDGPVEPGGPNNPFLHVLVVVNTLQEQGKDDRIVEKTTMTAAVTGAETRHGDQPLHARSLWSRPGYGWIARTVSCARRWPGGDVDTERLDNHVDVFEGVPDRIAIERVAGYLIQGHILDGYACRRACQRANAMNRREGQPSPFQVRCHGWRQ
jgi:hypothetical protein